MIRAMNKADIPPVVQGWNDAFAFDRVDEQRFENVVFGDPNYEKEGTLVAEQERGIVGFAACAARRSLIGADGRGTEKDRHTGYLKGIFYRTEAAGAALLERVRQFLHSAGKKAIKVVEYGGGRYFFPGIDPRYARLLGFLKDNGFEETRRLHDVSLDLQAYQPGTGDYQRRQWARVTGAGIRVVPYRPEMLPAMRAFVEAFHSPGWFGRGWEADWQDRHTTIVAVKADRVLGFASYWPARAGSGIGGFGPIGTLEAERSKGIGSCMMDQCMRELKHAGATQVIAGWANVPFYLANAWRIHREYLVLQKGT